MAGPAADCSSTCVAVAGVAVLGRASIAAGEVVAVVAVTAGECVVTVGKSVNAVGGS